MGLLGLLLLLIMASLTMIENSRNFVTLSAMVTVAEALDVGAVPGHLAHVGAGRQVADPAGAEIAAFGQQPFQHPVVAEQPGAGPDGDDRPVRTHLFPVCGNKCVLTTVAHGADPSCAATRGRITAR